MALSITPDSKTNITITNVDKRADYTWNDADWTWDDASGTWEQPEPPFSKESKNSLTINPISKT